jgi:glycosyltransferase involved in cell wall biosynthesis
MSKKTVCLVMIVKNEAHVILDTLRQLLTFIPFDSWSICDTGSTDSTREDITAFFQARGIPGQIHDTEWRDFGYNRTLAFELGRSAADYAFVWDADDSIEGNFVFPKDLEADWYKFMFGNRSGFRYSRCQLFSNQKRWKYVGVLHEYPACVESCGNPADVLGDYYFVSGRSGARNKNPMKYHDDARILEAAYKEALATKDPIHCRYAFYCAQSYASANVHEKAAEYYKVVLGLPSWAQEKYMSCLNIYTHLTSLNREEEGFFYLVEAVRYDPTRVECVYRLVKHYCAKGMAEVALSYYGFVQPYFEHKYLTEVGRERLFANMDEYDFYLPYYMVIVGDRTKRYDICAKMYEIIFTKRYMGATKWWIDNLFTNMQFCMHAFPKTLEFVRLMFDYVDELRRHQLYLSPAHNATLTKFIDSMAPVICAKPSDFEIVNRNTTKPRVMLTMTTCKRLDLFVRTVNSILNVWTDAKSIDSFFCIDDNSSEEDRQVMRAEFPFFEYYMKTPAERGHKESMNIIWNVLRQRRPTYWIHLEDDWMFFHPGSFVERGIKALETHASSLVRQIVFNRNYGVVYNDLERTGGFQQKDNIILHELNPNLPGRHSGYWPHYSLQPSITKTETILALGDYTTTHRFFERGYADKYNAAGFKTAFFDSVHSVHIGKQHWESEGKNAYALNEVGQFDKIVFKNEPLKGTMGEHLDQILKKIVDKRPFGIIRPSDGEHTVLLNRTLTNCDAWTFQAGGVLREQLLASIRIVDPNLYIGIPCNTCRKPWNCTEEIYTNYTKRWAVPEGQRTYANVFMNSNWAKWTEFIKSYAPGIYLVGSGGNTSPEIKIKGKHIIGSTLVDRWDSAHQAETDSLYKFIDSLRGELVCFAAGPLSKVWIPLCMTRNPANMYVDVGASLDIFTKGVTNRSYTDAAHPFAKETCVFRQVPKQNPYLVYFCVFFNDAYVNLLKMLLTSIVLFSRTDGIDFVVFTSTEFKGRIEDIGTLLGITIKTHCMECNSVHEASSAKLSIFDYAPVTSYEKVLYLDTDILIQGDLMKLLEEPLDELVYALPEGTIGHEFWGGTLFDLVTVDPKQAGINAGTFLFRPTEPIATLFRDISEHIAAMKAENKTLPLCLEQPFLNFHCISKNRYDAKLLREYATLYDSKAPPPPSSPTGIAICHFAWPLGDALSKHKRMAAHLSHICLNYAEIYPGSKAQPPYAAYTWGTGQIEFTKTGLKTSWVPGTYEVLDARTVIASWGRCKHLVRFNSSLKGYISMRIGDAIVTTGTRIIVPTKNLIYFCVFYNRDYCKLARLLLTSMRLYSSTDTFDILVLTTEDFRKDLQTISAELRIDLRIHTLPYKTVFEAACSRLQIFGYPEIAEYNTILYLDTDIIVKGELGPLFKIPTKDRIYAIESGTIASPSFGRQFYTGWTDYAKTGFNSGTLLFPNSPKIQGLFGRIWTHAMEHAADPPYCMDQPFINYHAMKDDLYDNKALNPFVSLYEDNDIVTNEATSVLSHFSYPIGNFAHKYGRMTKYLLGKMWAKQATTNFTVGKTYNWAKAGTLIFTKTGLETTWGNGTYETIGPGRVKASWNGYSHHLTFKSPDEFLSIRTSPEDFVVTFGSLQAQTGARIYVHGDSHAMLLFKDINVGCENLSEYGRSLDLPCENLSEYGTTMHRIGRDGIIPKHRASHNSEDSTFVFVYGEVDCRAHMKRHIDAGRTAEKICDTLVTAYFKTIKSNITTYKSIIVVGVPPPADKADHTHTHKPIIPFLGTNAERVEYTRLLNARIEAACFEHGYMFFAPFENYTRADGCLEYSLSDGCIHIGKNAEFLNTFRLMIGCPEIPLVLHTCDAYEQFWNHWYFFFKRYVTGISKVYFLTEEKSPVFASEVTVIKTGKGEWGQRLITALEQIPEAQIFYMQEDFWASKPFNPSRYVPQFFDKKMDTMRIMNKGAEVYELDLVREGLYRFQQNSQYLMCHQFGLWNRDYFLKWLSPTDTPWTSELEMTPKIAKTAHAIYLVDHIWYEAVVRKGILQPNGIELLQRHKKEIAESFLANDWYSNFLLKIREHLARDPIESFPSWKILEWTMFTVANAAERAAIGYAGEPESLLEKNRLHHKFLWKKFGEIAKMGPAGIFEFGGGYGQLRSVVYEANPDTGYAIYDFPELHAIQRQHLGGIPTTFYTAADLPAVKEKYNAFVSFWAYTECPKEVRDGLVPFLKSSKFDVLFFGLAQTFQLDNVAYLRGLASTLGYSVEFLPIDEMKSHDGQQYFCIMRRAV